MTKEIIKDLLERCLEFIHDGNEPLDRVRMDNLVYCPRTRLSVLNDEWERKRKECLKIERETILHNNIKKALEGIDKPEGLNHYPCLENVKVVVTKERLIHGQTRNRESNI